MSGLDLDRAAEGSGAGLGVAGRRHRNPTHGRQGKRLALGPAHVVGKIEEFANAAETRCWRFPQIVKTFQASERRRRRSHRGAGA
jgi:hypothetical protein